MVSRFTPVPSGRIVNRSHLPAGSMLDVNTMLPAPASLLGVAPLCPSLAELLGDEEAVDGTGPSGRDGCKEQAAHAIRRRATAPVTPSDDLVAEFIGIPPDRSRDPPSSPDRLFRWLIGSSSLPPGYTREGVRGFSRLPRSSRPAGLAQRGFRADGHRLRRGVPSRAHL